MKITFVGFTMVVDGRKTVAEFHTRDGIDDLMADPGSLGSFLRDLYETNSPHQERLDRDIADGIFDGQRGEPRIFPTDPENGCGPGAWRKP